MIDHARLNEWQLFSDDPVLGIQTWRLDVGDGYIVQKKIHYRTEDLLAQNAEDQAGMRGSGWGDGRLVARVPLNLAWKELMPAIIEGDEAYAAKWLNDGDHAKFRVKEGKL